VGLGCCVVCVVCVGVLVLFINTCAAVLIGLLVRVTLALMGALAGVGTMGIMLFLGKTGVTVGAVEALLLPLSGAKSGCWGVGAKAFASGWLLKYQITPPVMATAPNANSIFVEVVMLLFSFWV
jgi:hypothetical protein